MIASTWASSPPREADRSVERARRCGRFRQHSPRLPVRRQSLGGEDTSSGRTRHQDHRQMFTGPTTRPSSQHDGVVEENIPVSFLRPAGIDRIRRLLAGRSPSTRADPHHPIRASLPVIAATFRSRGRALFVLPNVWMMSPASASLSCVRCSNQGRWNASCSAPIGVLSPDLALAKVLIATKGSPTASQGALRACRAAHRVDRKAARVLTRVDRLMRVSNALFVPGVTVRIAGGGTSFARP